MSDNRARDPYDHPRTATSTRPTHNLGEVEFREDNGVMVAAIIGEVDVSNAATIAGAFSDLSELSFGMVVDLRRLAYLDSSGISLLHDLGLRMRQRGQPLVVVSPPSSPPRRVLELTALDSHTLILDDLDPAIESLRGRRGSASSRAEDTAGFGGGL